MSGRTTARIGKKRRRVTSVAELFPPQGQWTEEDSFIARLPYCVPGT